MYRVQLRNFEGPLDLLLFFIKRDELDVYDIPISYITGQFLEYIHFLEELDLSVASEFILMASTLMAIKARMMLPHKESAYDEEPEADPRYELMQALLEYRRYREMAEELHVMDLKSRELFYRGYLEPDQVEPELNRGEMLRDITLFDLMSAFHRVMEEQRKKPPMHEIEQMYSSIEEQSLYIVQHLTCGRKCTFYQLCEGLTHRIHLVTTFIALLEMIREQVILLFIGENPEFFHVILNPERDSDQLIRSYREKMKP